jgi:phospholipase C
VFDHTSVLKLIEWRWRLAPLTPRDASNDVNNLAYALDFTNSQTAVPSLPKPHTPWIAMPCFANLFGGLSTTGTAPPGGMSTAPAPTSSSDAQRTVALQTLRALAQENKFRLPSMGNQ